MMAALLTYLLFYFFADCLLHSVHTHKKKGAQGLGQGYAVKEVHISATWASLLTDGGRWRRDFVVSQVRQLNAVEKRKAGVGRQDQ